jgi:hypothetical protein
MLALEADGLGARRIAKTLAAERTVNPRTGRAWRPSLVAQVLDTANRRATVLSAAGEE